MRIKGTERGRRESAASIARAEAQADSPLPALQRLADDSQAVQRLAVMQAKGGLPAELRTGVESLSGQDLSDVQVHYNSSRPAAIQAHAFAQGSDIHVAPGQERHLPHEAWHVVQQREGRVHPTTSVEGTPVNDDPGLEAEADRMGARAQSAAPAGAAGQRQEIAQREVVQRVDIVLSDARKTHILDGDATGGGHRSGTGKPGKSEFPPDWSDGDIIDAVKDAAETGASLGAGNKPGSDLREKVVNGVTIKVVVGADGGIITAFPTGGPGVVRNPW